MTAKAYLTAALVAVALAAQAQTTTPPLTPAQLTREMTERLHLNDGQYVRLLAVNKTWLTHQREIEQATQHDPAARKARLAELQGQYEQECARILSPSQLSLMQQDNARPTDVANGNG